MSELTLNGGACSACGRTRGACDCSEGEARDEFKDILTNVSDDELADLAGLVGAEAAGRGLTLNCPGFAGEPDDDPMILGDGIAVANSGPAKTLPDWSGAGGGPTGGHRPRPADDILDLTANRERVVKELAEEEEQKPRRKFLKTTKRQKGTDVGSEDVLNLNHGGFLIPGGGYFGDDDD
jgi:hypothetical protein